MKTIKITEERMAKVLPSEIKNTNVLSDNAKKTLAAIMNYFSILNIAKSSNYLVCPNSVLRESVGIRNNDLISAVQELIECDLIERQVGHKRVEGEKATASTYEVKWLNLVKPIKKKNTFEELFSEFLKPSGTPLGTTDTDTDIDAVIDTEADTEVEDEVVFDNEVEDDNDDVSDNEVVIDNEVEIKKQFEIECKNEKIEVNTEETYVDKALENELEMAIEENLIPTEEKKKVEVKKQFLQHCDNPIRRKLIPDVEDLSQYIKRTRAYAYKK